MAEIAPNPSHKGKKIQSNSVAFKLKVIEYAKKESNTKASQVYEVARKRVIEWRKAENELKSVGQQAIRCWATGYLHRL